MAWHGWGLEDQDVVDPGNGRDGGPVGAYPGVWILVREGAAGVLPACSIGPSVQGRMRSSFIRIDPAGVQVTE